jgi:putative peptidoglycan lipid II flippase
MTQVRVLNTGQMIRAALVVLLGFLSSGILGLIRTAAYAAAFGATDELDVFYTAQRIPEIVFTLVAGGALGSAFIPVFNRYGNEQDAEKWRFASVVTSWSAAAAAVLGLILALTAPLYMPVLLSNQPAEYQALAADLTRWLLVTTVIFSISGLMMGILNAHQQFLLPALAISMYNIGLIVGVVVIAPNLPTDSGLFAYNASGDVNVYGLALGAILGAVLHLLIQVPGLIRVRAQLRPLFRFNVTGTGLVLRLMLPRVLGLAVTQINFLVNVYFADGMAEGSNSVLTTAWFLMFFALGIIAQSAGTAVFPSLAKLAADGDLKGFGERLRPILSAVLFFALPASIGLMVLGEPLVRLLTEREAWTAQATAGTAWALAFFAVGVAGHALLEVLSRAFYALGDTRTPVTIGIISLVMNIVLSIVFIQFIGDPTSLARGPIAGLALANSVTTLIEAGVLWFLLHRRLASLESPMLFQPLGRMLVGAAAMGFGVWGLVSAMNTAPTFAIVVAGGGVGVLIYFALTAALGVSEASLLPKMVLRRLRR